MYTTLEEYEAEAKQKSAPAGVPATLQGLKGALAGFQKTLQTYESKLVAAAGGAETIDPNGPLATVVDSGMAMLSMEIGRLQAAIDAALAAAKK